MLMLSCVLKVFDAMNYIARATALFLCISYSLASAEDNVHSPIVIKEGVFGYHCYMQDDDKLSHEGLQELLKEESSTEGDMRNAEGLRFAEDFFAYMGAGVFGIALGAEVAGPNEGDGPNWGAVLLVGGGLLGLSAHYRKKSDAYYKKAIDKYNNIRIKHDRSQMRRFRIYLGSNNLGLSIRF